MESGKALLLPAKVCSFFSFVNAFIVGLPVVVDAKVVSFCHRT